jgi:hypothetical protein
MGAFGAGLFLLGPLCSFLVQRYRRNMVFICCAVCLAATMLLPFTGWRLALPAALIWRLLQGALFGLAEMVLSSTLIIDTCHSRFRTEANHTATWFGRFALGLGPMTGLLITDNLSFEWVPAASVACLMACIILVLFVHFPFRVPDDHLPKFCLDRFLLPAAFPLFRNLFPFTVAAGLLFTIPATPQDFALMLLGLIIALVAQHYVFRNADLKSEVVTGYLLFAAALIILLSTERSVLVPPLVGIGLGLVGARFLLFFIKLSHHCKRGTAQSSFLLTWESGLAVGIAMGYDLLNGETEERFWIALALTACCLLDYVIVTHRWFLKHKNR